MGTAVPTSFVGTSAVPTNLSEQTTISNSADRTLLLKLQEEEVLLRRLEYERKKFKLQSSLGKCHAQFSSPQTKGFKSQSA